jgi:hypothetical protein
MDCIPALELRLSTGAVFSLAACKLLYHFCWIESMFPIGPSLNIFSNTEHVFTDCELNFL